MVPYQIDESSAAHGLHRLLVRVREDEADAVLAAVLVEVLERVHARRVERGHAAHADDQVLRELLDRDVGDAVRHAEEHGAVDLVHAHARGQLAQVRDLRVLVAVVLPAADLGLVAQALHEQHERDHHANADRHDQVKDHREQEGDHQHRHIALGRGAQLVHHRAPAGHVVGDLQ